MGNDEIKASTVRKIFFLLIAIFVLFHSLSKSPYVKYGKIIFNMKKISSGEYIKKIQIHMPSKPFLKALYPGSDITDFYVFLKNNYYSRETINQMGEELKSVLDKELADSNLLRENFSYYAGIRIGIQDPNADWLKLLLRELLGYEEQIYEFWSQKKMLRTWGGREDTEPREWTSYDSDDYY
jgi:hypothetical protein